MANPRLNELIDEYRDRIDHAANEAEQQRLLGGLEALEQLRGEKPDRTEGSFDTTGGRSARSGSGAGNVEVDR